MSKESLSTTLEASVISLSNAFGPLVVQGDGIEVEFRDAKVHVRSGEIVTTPATSKLSTAAEPAAPKIGDIIQDRPNAGWIYCEAKGVEPFLVAPKDSGVMRWRKAMEYAAHERSKLPSGHQIRAMYMARNTGALKDSFNTSCTDTAAQYWFEKGVNPESLRNRPYSYKSFCDGHESVAKFSPLSLRLVRPYFRIGAAPGY